MRRTWLGVSNGDAMNLHDSPLLASDIVTLECPEGQEGLEPNQEAGFFLEGDQWFMRQNTVVKPVRPGKDKHLFEGLARRRETLWLLTRATAKQVFMGFLAPSDRLDAAIKIGVDAFVAEFLYEKREIAEATVAQACAWLTNEFLIETTPRKLIVARFTTGATADFQVLGRLWRADVQPVDGKGYLIRRLAPRPAQASRLTLLEGYSEFVDASAAAQLEDPQQKAMLEAALQNNTAYLELWKLYNDLSWKRAQEEASRLGVLSYQACEGREYKGGNAWRLIPKNCESLQTFKERWAQLEIADATQVEVTESAPDWTVDLPDATAQARAVRGRLVFEADSVLVVPDERRKGDAPPHSGYVYYSLAGDRTVGKRREEAKRAIDSGRRLPQLRYLLEGVSVPVERHRKLDDVTPYAQETFKGGKPTDRQRDALRVALNTPDVALIIGPPGTGKTQVIAALQRRLAEEGEGRSLRGQVLISSYQHDAVDNALSRSNVFGLPPVRVGGRQGSGKLSVQFAHWGQERANYLDERVDELERSEPLLKQMKLLRHELQLLRIAKLDASGRVQALTRVAALLEQAADSGARIPSELESRWTEYLDTQQSREVASGDASDRRAVLLRVRALRVDPIGFADDGDSQAHALARALYREKVALSEPQQQALERAADADTPEPALLAELRQLRDHLLDRLLPDYRPPSIRSRLDDEGRALLTELENALEKKISASRKGIAGVLTQLSNALRFDPWQAQSTTEEYAMVVGATCQQAAGNQMSSLKQVAGLEHASISFDTVVIDEAARANPLDLFVPMAMAERRIILVGDDRQLPHLLEPDIEQEVARQNELGDVERKAFETSLFERLRVQLQRLEKEDSVQRVVMLDTQFRMHPVLGDFISKHFYEKVGMEAVKPGREAEVFRHTLEGYENKVCAWLNVPADAGNERRVGTSRIRAEEASLVAQEVARLLEQADQVSIGVITFYSAQALEIMRELEKLRIMGATQHGYEPAEAYRMTLDGEERLRVGTVDAFQGKEFDVVLLSNVRTSRKRFDNQALDPEQREAQRNARYGFLRLPNRMNVAMSRQRKLLIVAGDLALAEGPEAEEAVPALAAFATLCRGEHGCIR